MAWLLVLERGVFRKIIPQVAELCKYDVVCFEWFSCEKLAATQCIKITI